MHGRQSEASLNRKQFIQSHGADCKNWTWSWSFVNHRSRFVIFGLWQDKKTGQLGLILDSSWRYLAGRKQSGYSQAIEHLRLVEEHEYRLYTFPMKGTPRHADRGEDSPASIAEFIPELTEGLLAAFSGKWYVTPFAESYETIAEIVDPGQLPADLVEGATSTVLVNVYERNPEARRACLRHFGSNCQACGMNFRALYGALGDGYIHVHHIKPIHLCGGNYIVDPIKDLIPVCANCHAMLHRRADPLSINDLKEILTRNHDLPTV